jgi:hypothetical protein
MYHFMSNEHAEGLFSTLIVADFLLHVQDISCTFEIFLKFLLFQGLK